MSRKPLAARAEPPQPLVVDEKAAAEKLGLSVSWLQKDRQKKKLIPFFRLGGSVRYNLERVLEAMAALEEGGAHLRPRRTGRSA